MVRGANQGDGGKGMTDKIQIDRELLEALRDCADDCVAYEKALGNNACDRRILDYGHIVEESEALLDVPSKFLEELRRDAERYRFLRDAGRADKYTDSIWCYALESFDEAIDAAIAAEKSGDE